MSSILLLKDHELGKKGAVVSVPFGKGKELLKSGIGVYPSQMSQPTPSSTKIPSDAETDRLRKENEDLKKQLAQAQAQIDELLTSPPVDPKEDAKDKGKK